MRDVIQHHTEAGQGGDRERDSTHLAFDRDGVVEAVQDFVSETAGDHRDGGELHGEISATHRSYPTKLNAAKPPIWITSATNRAGPSAKEPASSGTMGGATMSITVAIIIHAWTQERLPDQSLDWAT